MSFRWSFVGGNGSLSGNGGHSVLILQPHGAMEVSGVLGLVMVALMEGSLGKESRKMSKRIT